jgi:hypothetical protein
LRAVAPTNKSQLANGKYTITATIDNLCWCPLSITKDVFGGTPSFETIDVNGGPQAIPNYINNPCQLNVWTNEIGVNYTWEPEFTNYSNGSLTVNGQNGNSASAYAYPFFRVNAKVSNQCGNGATTTFYLYNQGSYYRMASPNPNPTTNVEVEVNEFLLKHALKKIELISHATNRKVRGADVAALKRNINAHPNPNANKQIALETGDLPRGLYYLNLSFEGGKDFTERIILQ